ncbi:tripartite tricarboxylate transporter TctB family protein [Salibacterium sp. K-3]
MVINKNIVSGVFFVMLSIGLLILLPFQIENKGTQGLSARTLPSAALGLMLVFSLLFLIKSITKNKQDTSADVELTIYWRKELKVLGLFALIGLYISSLPFIGYLPASFLMSVIVLWYLKAKNKWYYAAAIALVVVIYYVFTVLLNIQLP